MLSTCPLRFLKIAVRFCCMSLLIIEISLNASILNRLMQQNKMSFIYTSVIKKVGKFYSFPSIRHTSHVFIAIIM